VSDRRRRVGRRDLGRVAPAAALIVLTALAPRCAWPAQQPLWEFGLGVGAVVFNDYRGADTTHVYPVPVPYFVYRGKFLQSDRDGLRGKLFRQDRIELNLSVNATTPVRNDSARAGMPDLRSTVEIGPSLNAHLWRSADSRAKLDLQLPARTAFTVESHPRGIGWFYAPHLNLDLAQYAAPTGWKLGLLAGPLFAQRRYDDYFYSVAPQYATPTRPAYAAPGGYAGTQALVSLARRFPDYWIGAYLRHDSLGGAAFSPSPLVKRDNYWSGGLGFVWMIGKSQRLVESDE
jgi:outer membrane scaffolding protein for murein synthesis (MipA/OmpV family)